MEKWKDRVVEKLKELPLQRNAVQSIPLELRRLELERDGIGSSLSGEVAVKHSGRPGERLLWNVIQREALERNLELAKGYVAFVERGLEGLDDEEREVLERVYVLREPDVVENLREEWGMMEKRSVYKRLDRILYRLTLAMYGVEAS